MLKLAEAEQAARELVRRLRVGGKRPVRVELVGSVRRGAPTSYDVDLLVTVRRCAAQKITLSATRGKLRLAGVISGGARHQMLWVAHNDRKIVLDLFFATPSERPYALFHYTGPKTYNIRTRRLAKLRGWVLNQYGITRRPGKGGRPPPRRARTERGVARALGVSWRRPASRK